MNYFVQNDILQALQWLLSQLKIQPDSSGFYVASTPFRFHFPYPKVPALLHAWGLPTFDQFGNGLPELSSVPIIHDGLTLFQRAFGLI